MMITGAPALMQRPDQPGQPTSKIAQVTQAFFCGKPPPTVTDPSVDSEPSCQAYQQVVLGGSPCDANGNKSPLAAATASSDTASDGPGSAVGHRTKAAGCGQDLATVYEQPADFSTVTEPRRPMRIRPTDDTQSDPGGDGRTDFAALED